MESSVRNVALNLADLESIIAPHPPALPGSTFGQTPGSLCRDGGKHVRHRRTSGITGSGDRVGLES